LSKEQADLRRLRFETKIYELNGHQNPWLSMGRDYSSKHEYINSAICFERSNDPDGLFLVALCYSEGEISQDSDRYKQAEKYLIKSGSDMAYCNLGILYADGKIGRKLSLPASYQKAAEHYYKLQTSEGFFNLLIMIKYNLVRSIDKIKIEESLNEKILDLPKHKQNYYKGKISSLNEDFEKAINYLSQAVMLGYEEALPCLKSAQEVFEAEHKLKTLKNESAQQEQSKTTSQASLIQKTSGNIASESLHAEDKTNQEKYSKDEQGAEVGKSSTSSSSSSSDEQTSSDSDEEEADDSSS
jgi:TPR repeat protein